jgi:hypothetical protein
MDAGGRPPKPDFRRASKAASQLPLRFALAPPHHQHHEQEPRCEPKNGLHNHVIHVGRFSFLFLNL